MEALVYCKIYPYIKNLLFTILTIFPSNAAEDLAESNLRVSLLVRAYRAIGSCYTGVKEAAVK